MTHYFFADPQHIKKERAKAREARKSRWWAQKCAPGLCYYCHEKFKPSQLTMDHIIPVARGGTTTPGNVVPACKNCNKEKGLDTPVDQYFDKLKDKKTPP